MLTRLPLELVRTIVGFVGPVDPVERQYKERQEDLRSICLVSKPLREIAQPILFEVVSFGRIRSQAALDAPYTTLDKRDQFKQYLKAAAVHLQSRTPREEALQIFRRVLQEHHSLKDLSFHTTCPTIIELAPHALARLHLSFMSFAVPKGTTFPHLIELSLFMTNRSEPSLVDLEAFPALRHLACYPSSSWPLTSIDPSNLAQLDSLVLDIRGCRQGHPFRRFIDDKEFSRRILLEFDYADDWKIDFAFNPLVNLRIVAPQDDEEVSCQDIKSLLEYLKENSDEASDDKSTLRSVFLSPSFIFDISEEQEVDGLQAWCAAQGLELVWEERSPNWNVESGISREFARRREEERLRALGSR